MKKYLLIFFLFFSYNAYSADAFVRADTNEYYYTNVQLAHSYINQVSVNYNYAYCGNRSEHLAPGGGVCSYFHDSVLVFTLRNLNYSRGPQYSTLSCYALFPGYSLDGYNGFCSKGSGYSMTDAYTDLLTLDPVESSLEDLNAPPVDPDPVDPELPTDPVTDPEAPDYSDNNAPNMCRFITSSHVYHEFKFKLYDFKKSFETTVYDSQISMDVAIPNTNLKPEKCVFDFIFWPADMEAAMNDEDVKCFEVLLYPTGAIAEDENMVDISSFPTCSIATDPEADQDEDGVINEEDEDKDGDGVNNDEDRYPHDPNFNKDTDGDGTPDELDKDIDGDGWLNDNDMDPINYDRLDGIVTEGPTLCFLQNGYYIGDADETLGCAIYGNDNDNDGHIDELHDGVEVPDQTDAPLPPADLDVPGEVEAPQTGYWEPYYENGFDGALLELDEKLKESQFMLFLNSFKFNGSNGEVPFFTFHLDIGFHDFGVFTIDPNDYMPGIFGFIKVIVLLSAVFAAFKIVF